MRRWPSSSNSTVKLALELVLSVSIQRLRRNYHVPVNNRQERKNGAIPHQSSKAESRFRASRRRPSRWAPMSAA
jgi:hypothetical protein